MKKLLTFALSLLAAACVCAQPATDDFKTTVIDKKAGDFPLRIDLSTPFASYLTRVYLNASGKASLWDSISSYQFRDMAQPRPSDREVSAEEKEETLGSIVREMIVYRDSAAAVIACPADSSFYDVNLSRLEDGRWVNAGQDGAGTIAEARELAKSRCKASMEALHRIARFRQIPADEKPFADYLLQNGMPPKEFVLRTLAERKLVVYGEIHRRRVSWELMKSVIADPRFAKTTGTIFMELPAHSQSAMDSFFAKDTLDSSILLGIFGEMVLPGWLDRGEYEFLCSLWKLNRTLSARKKIRVVLTDYRAPFNSIQSGEQLKNYPAVDRNTHMADVVERTIRSSPDSRHSLFIVGCAHACKSDIAGIAAYVDAGRESAPTAGAQLAARFSGSDVFTIVQHHIIMSNYGQYQCPVRDGLFDRAFREAGNAPVAFALKGSPFGAEPMDILYEYAYRQATGNYEDNYDGYIFLQPLADEAPDYLLYDLFTDSFVRELKRRAALLDIPEDRPWWYGLKATEMTPEGIKARLRSPEGAKKFPFMQGK